MKGSRNTASQFANSTKRQEMTDNQASGSIKRQRGVAWARRELRRAAVALVGVAAVALAVATAPASAAVSFDIETSHSGSLSRGDEYFTYTVVVKNTGTTPTTAPTNLNLSLPAGTAVDDIVLPPLVTTGWSCLPTTSTCTYSNSPAIAGGADFPALTVGVAVDPAVVPDTLSTVFTAFGGGADSAGLSQHSFAVGPWLTFGLKDGSFIAGACDAPPVAAPPTTAACEAGGLGDAFVQAGGHPFAGNAAFDFTTKKVKPNVENPEVDAFPYENVRDAAVNLPPGFVANPTVVAGGCTLQQIELSVCPERFAVGRTWAVLNPGFRNDQMAPVYKIQTEKGYPAAFAFRPVALSSVTVVLRPKVRPGDFTVTAFAPTPPQGPALESVHYFTFCSYGAQTSIVGGFAQSSSCKQPDDPGALSVPFLTNPTRCTGVPDITSIDLSSYQNPGSFDTDGFPDLSDSDWKTYQATSPALEGCGDVPFDPSVTVGLSSSEPDSATGLRFDLEVPQDGLVDPEGIATSHLDKTVVELPEGMSVNPSAGTGLEGCTDEQMGLVTRNAPGPFPVQFDGQPVDCPDGSKLGTVLVTSPLIDETVQGVMYLGQPKSTDPTSGQMFRLFLALRNDDIGLMAKLEGSSTADPQTGKLVATFDNNPQLPFDHLEVRLKEGNKGVLATPPDCGTKTTDTELEPWSGTGAVDRPSSFQVAGDCDEKFAPALEAGNSDNRGRGQGGTYSFKFSRPDGHQWLGSLTATLPDGLLASVKDVPLCSNAAADAGSCPAASKIGIVDAKAGAGDPFVLEQKGEMFLTEGYRGGEYGLAVKVRPVAGPFRGDMELSPIVVRQAIHVDRTSARVTAISDPFPVIHHGIPLRVREVNVLVDRGGFMLNPSDCSAKQSRADLVSTENAAANLADPFQVSGCSNLAFEPKLTLALSGRKQVTTGKHPGIRAQVTQRGVSEAGIEKAVVRLPKSLALDVNNAQALCEFADGTKPDLENHCPKGSIVGRARAKTPLLKDDLAGNVYFVKNIRRDPVTGNEIRTLPMIIVALRGEISINLKGESDTTKAGKLVNTFNGVPDAPVSQFNLNIQGGNNGILAVTRTRRAKINLCAKPRGHIAEADMDAHNARRYDRNIRMTTPCSKRQTKAAKRAAKKARKARNQ